MDKKISIEINNVTKTYKIYDKKSDRLKEALNLFGKKFHKDYIAVNDFPLKIYKGETVGIIGKNGSGKSTLLKMITGVLSPTSGTIKANGKISAILEIGGGFSPELTGMENIQLNALVDGTDQKDLEAKAKDIIDFAELGDFIYQPIKTYSSGMKARLGFALAINIKPDILIIDETLSVGDAAFKRKCFAKIEEIRKSGATVLFVSHSEGSIVKLCNRAVWIHNGVKILDGNPKFVTGLYLKYCNKTRINKNEMQKEFETIIQANGTKKENKKQRTLKQSNPGMNNISNQERAKNNIEEYYNPNIESKSTIYYEEKGAKITDVKITTMNEKKVNVLVQGKEYIYSYKVNFQSTDKKRVIFGMSICNTNGIVLVSGNYPQQQQFGVVEEDVVVKWHFKCNLLKGDYFFSAGIMKDTKAFMARIKDVYMIKIINDQNKQMRGLIDINLKGTIHTGY